MHDLNPSLTAKLENIRVVLADVDGTLFRSPTDTLEHVARQLRKLPRAGIRFSLATGRAIAGVQTVIRTLEQARGQWPARRWTLPVIAYNGAVVAIPSEPMVLDRFLIPPAAVAGTIATVLDADCTAFAYVCRQPFDLQPTEGVHGYTRTIHRPASEFNGMPVLWSENTDVAVHDVVAMLIADPAATGNLPSVAATLEAQQLLIRVTTSGGPYLEVTSTGNSKLRGMRSLAHRLDCDIHQIMAIGDNLNDVEMLEHAGVSIAVANAPESVKRMVDYVSGFIAGEGVVDSLRLLLGQRRTTVRYEKLTGEANVRFRR
jgi:hydroxymethylpyrimidine pyrophosphatase-like HAD family hydrolase